MKPTLCLNVNLMRFLGSFKPSEEFGFSIDAYLGFPKSSISLDPKKTGFVVAPRFDFVLDVHGLSNIAQIAQPVVRPVSINVVYVPIRPFSVNVKPNKSMHKSWMAINHQLQVPSGWIASNLTGFGRAFIDAPSHNSSLGIVRKKLVEPRLCKHVAPHQSERHPESCSKRWMKPPVPRRVSCRSILQ